MMVRKLYIQWVLFLRRNLKAAVKHSGSPDLTGMETDHKRTKGGAFLFNNHSFTMMSGTLLVLVEELRLAVVSTLVSLNMDVSSTMILTPGPVLDFILTNQNLRDPWQIYWGRAKKMLKNLRVKARHNNMELIFVFNSANPVQAGSQAEFSQWQCHVHNVVQQKVLYIVRLT
ncbi:argonaute [Thalictrum thalictroides]|uniref:Argonaute n=1 Tax=Thalictrum thalictroides TaxID=46969 RepID=A0A7J6W513_THATH|nr:argonaute [Thalictrum thalictroides]